MKQRRDKEKPSSSFTMNGVRVVPKFHEVETGRKLKTPKGGGEPVEVVEYERFTIHTVVGYDIRQLRDKMQGAIKHILSGERKQVELNLERFPQVATVMGEIHAQDKTLTGAYTTDEEANTRFVIRRNK